MASKFNDNHRFWVQRYARRHMSDIEIAKVMNEGYTSPVYSKTTIYSIRKKFGIVSGSEQQQLDKDQRIADVWKASKDVKKCQAEGGYRDAFQTLRSLKRLHGKGLVNLPAKYFEKHKRNFVLFEITPGNLQNAVVAAKNAAERRASDAKARPKLEEIRYGMMADWVRPFYDEAQAERIARGGGAV